MTAELATRHLEAINAKFIDGRAETAPEINVVDEKSDGTEALSNDEDTAEVVSWVRKSVDRGGTKVRFNQVVQVRPIPSYGRGRSCKGDGRLSLRGSCPITDGSNTEYDGKHQDKSNRGDTAQGNGSHDLDTEPVHTCGIGEKFDWEQKEFDGELLDGGPWVSIKNPRTGNDIVIKDVIADAMLQQIILRPDEYSVIATLNLNGDYISDALAAQVGGIGIAPGANLSDDVAIFEATHGTAPKYAGQDKVNPGSLILSAEMMLRHMGWGEAADLVIKGIEGAISEKKVTYDFERLMDDATLMSCSEFGDVMIENM